MFCKNRHWIPLVASISFFLIGGELNAAEPDGKRVEFNRDIRPILSDVCYQCHGPDSVKRKADLRLDREQDAFAKRDGHQIIVPGDPAASELYRRLTTGDPDERMPPADSKRTLTKQQIELIRRWIEQGAKWQKHWSFILPQRPAAPRVTATAWTRNELDHFVLARLEREGLNPSSPAEKTTLIRRVSLDLTGLPPTLEEIDAFLADDSPDAYERVVDRLLASARFGERMAVPWLYAARYADTSGYQNDGPRYMWRWRDWVINAINANMPFDQFTIEQIAGDMLPDATLDQQIASAFNRNHRGNAEGGIIPEEYEVEYVVDRVDTTSTVWLGLTMGCSRCHDHKYDPISQKEFYQVFAYFNNVPEYGRAIKEGNSPPFIKAPTPVQKEQLERLRSELAQAQARLASHCATAALKQQVRKWAESTRSKSVDWTLTDGLVSHFPLENNAANVAVKTKREAVKLDVEFQKGRLGNAAHFSGKDSIEAGDVGKFGYFDKFSLLAWIKLDGEKGGTVVSRMTKVPRGAGYYLHIENGHVQANLVKRWLDDSMRVETKKRLESDRWYHVMMTYDGSRRASGIHVYVDGEDWPLNVNHDFLNQTMASDEPLRIGAGHSNFHGMIDDVRVYDRCIEPEEVEVASVWQSISQIAELNQLDNPYRQDAKLRMAFLDQFGPERSRKRFHQMQAARRRYRSFFEAVPTLMVMQETENPRGTFILERGQYDKPQQQVQSGVPEVLHTLSKDTSNNRAGFARWLVDRKNPLTARVTVNRYWQMLFGQGLVSTIEDFGAQGQLPTHPALLDWLATEFVRNGWNVKALMKTIVTSATYRQSSRVRPELLERDPNNRLLARGPRFRLSAEVVRDQALAAAGLLEERLGGASVKPYQPEGLWKEIATDTNYEQSKSPDLYRRSLYTYWKRTVAPPNMMNFDANARESCTVRETRTNTPLQALTLLNDVTYVEAARVLAERIMMSKQSKPADRIRLAFRILTGRQPATIELEILTSGFQFHRKRYKSDQTSAASLVGVGDSQPDKSLDVSELAAYTAIVQLILNLDEAITKE